jgi:TolA-binding protein
MSVVDLHHPEDLLDREASGMLTPPERERLERHLDQCETCRLERRVRADFRDEKEPLDLDFDVQRLLSEVLAPGTDRIVVPRVVPPSLARARTRRVFGVRAMLLAAAALLVAGAAAGAGWGGLRRLVSGRPSSITGVSGDVSASDAVTRANQAHASVTLVAPAPDVPSESAATPAAPVPDDKPETAPSAPDALATSENPGRVTWAARAPRHVAPLASVVAPSKVLEATESPAPPAADARLLFVCANGARRVGDRDRAADLYRTLINEYPAAAEAHEAQATLGRMLLEDGDAHAALHYFDDYLHVGGPLQEDVMADRAAALGRLGRSADEAAAWSSLLHSYPSSVHAARAATRLRELGDR